MFLIPDPPEIRNPEAAADRYYYGCYESEDRYSGLLIDDEEDIEND